MDHIAFVLSSCQPALFQNQMSSVLSSRRRPLVSVRYVKFVFPKVAHCRETPALRLDLVASGRVVIPFIDELSRLLEPGPV